MSNYPTGAETDPRAPYNEVELPEKEFEMGMTQILSRSVEVSSNEYEVSNGEVDYDNTDWLSIYKSKHMTPRELILEFERFLFNYRMSGMWKNKSEKKQLDYLMEECRDWIVDEENCYI